MSARQTAKHYMPFGSISAYQNTFERRALAFNPALDVSLDNVPHNISLSNVRSATILFNRFFSSSKSRNRRISDGIILSHLFGGKTAHRTLFFTTDTPIEIRCRIYPRQATNLRNRREFIVQLNKNRLLGVREFGCFQRSSHKNSSRNSNSK